jgi:putative transposase
VQSTKEGVNCIQSFLSPSLSFLYLLERKRVQLYLREMRNFDTNNHAIFSLNYHLILVVKYRRKVFSSQKMMSRFREIAEYIGTSHNISIKEVNGEPDHVHLLLRTKPNCDLAKYINAMKSASSRLLKKEFPNVQRLLWKSKFWSPSYCLITVGGAPIEVLKKYIESQSGPEIQ